MYTHTYMYTTYESCIPYIYAYTKYIINHIGNHYTYMSCTYAVFNTINKYNIC